MKKTKIEPHVYDISMLSILMATFVLRSDNLIVNQNGTLTVKNGLIHFLPCLHRTRTIRTSIAVTICNTEDGIHPESNPSTFVFSHSQRAHSRSHLVTTLRTASNPSLTPPLPIFIFSHSRHCAARSLSSRHLYHLPPSATLKTASTLIATPPLPVFISLTQDTAQRAHSKLSSRLVR